MPTAEERWHKPAQNQQAGEVKVSGKEVQNLAAESPPDKALAVIDGIVREKLQIRFVNTRENNPRRHIEQHEQSDDRVNESAPGARLIRLRSPWRFFGFDWTTGVESRLPRARTRPLCFRAHAGALGAGNAS